MRHTILALGVDGIRPSLLNSGLKVANAELSGRLALLLLFSFFEVPLGVTKGIYKTVHGSAPDLNRKGIANPIEMILSIGMMLEYSFKKSNLTCTIKNAVDEALDAGIITLDF